MMAALTPIADRLMAHLIEGAALFVYLGRTDGQVVEYVSDLIADPGAEAHIAEIIDTKRRPHFSGCAPAN